MSAANVEVVRGCIDAWRAGDFEKSLSYLADAATWQTGSVDTAVHHGPRGVARAMDEWVGAFCGYWLEPEGYIDAGDKVVLLVREGGVGKTSGVRVEEQAAMVFTVEDGLITRAHGFVDRGQALADAGLGA